MTSWELSLQDGVKQSMLELLLTSLIIQPPTQRATPPAGPSNCDQLMASGVSGAAVETCQGDDQKKRGDAAAKGSADRPRFFTAAIDHYRRAFALAADASTRTRLLDSIATLDDAAHLNELDQMDR